MKKIEYLDFATADIAFKAYGKTLEEAFENAALAMFDVMVEVSKIKEKEEKIIEIKSESLESLVFDFLSELLFIFDVEKMVFSSFKVEIKKNEEYYLKAVCKGQKLTKEIPTKTEVKAITYHHMQIGKENNLYFVQVLLDI